MGFIETVYHMMVLGIGLMWIIAKLAWTMITTLIEVFMGSPIGLGILSVFLASYVLSVIVAPMVIGAINEKANEIHRANAKAAKAARKIKS